MTLSAAEPQAPAALAATFMLGYLVVRAAFSLTATGLQWLLDLRGLVSPTMMAVTSSPMRFLVVRRRAGRAVPS